LPRWELSSSVVHLFIGGRLFICIWSPFFYPDSF
jgi:hypothetical protein